MRYVYLMHRPGTDQYKIGIARSVRYRRFMIDQDVQGPVRVVMARKAPNALGIEKELHAVFSDRRFTLNAGPNAGKTEWFHFGLLELICFIYWFNLLTIRPYLETAAVAVAAGLIAFLKLI